MSQNTSNIFEIGDGIVQCNQRQLIDDFAFDFFFVKSDKMRRLEQGMNLGEIFHGIHRGIFALFMFEEPLDKWFAFFFLFLFLLDSKVGGVVMMMMIHIHHFFQGILDAPHKIIRASAQNNQHLKFGQGQMQHFVEYGMNMIRRDVIILTHIETSQDYGTSIQQ